MKTLVQLLAIALMPGTILFSQAPQAFKYQAIARDDAGNILINNPIGLRVSIVEGNKDGIAKYVETHAVKSNPYGIVNLVIGEGRVEKGDFKDINWGEDSYFVKMEMDITGGTDYKEMGISKLYAVPYALYAEQAGEIVSKEAEQHASVQKNSSQKTKPINSSRNGTPNTKFPADGASYMNVNTGRVGIGTTNPQRKLEVNGNILAKSLSLKTNQMILTDPNGNQWAIVIDTTGTMHLVDKFIECGDSLYDYLNGQYYQTVLIGVQCWMAENLNIGIKINSTTGGQLQTEDGIIEKYCYENFESNCDIYGGLYEWPEAMQYVTTEGAQGICPDGWHIPTDTEWTTLSDYLDGASVAGGKMKSTGTIEAVTGLWYDPNEGATNESGFTGFPGGYRSWGSGTFSSLGYAGRFHSSTEYDSSDKWHRILYNEQYYLGRGHSSKLYGYSVRCLQDD